MINTVGGSFSYIQLNEEFMPTNDDSYMFNFAGENMFGPGLHSDEANAGAEKNIGILPGDTIFDIYKDNARHVVLYLFGSGQTIYTAEYGSASVYTYSYDESTNSFFGKGLSSNPYHFQYYVDMTGSAFNDNKANESA